MSDVLLTTIEDGVATLTMNRPDSLNALNEDLSLALQEALKSVGNDPAVRCVVLTGAGRGFCSGADLSGSNIKPGEPIPVGDILRRLYNPIVLPITQMEKPVIAAVNGVAAGAGASLALACDLRIASDKARFIQAFIRIALVGDSGANYFLPRLVGFSKAMELALTGDSVDAHEALRIGLVNAVVPHDELEKGIAEFARPFATGPTQAYAATKRAMYFGTMNDLASTLDYEADLQEVLVRTTDAAAGVLSFLEKRPPNYQGK